MSLAFTVCHRDELYDLMETVREIRLAPVADVRCAVLGRQLLEGCKAKVIGEGAQRDIESRGVVLPRVVEGVHVGDQAVDSVRIVG